MERRQIFAILFALVCLSWAGQAQFVDNRERKLDCNGDRWRPDRTGFCEMRELSMPAGGQLHVDGRMNGGVAVKGWNRNDILVRAQVRGWADTDAAARSVAQQVRVTAAGGQVGAEGPGMDGRREWSVSYEIFAPHGTDLTLRAHNGGITIADVTGKIDFETTNGGVTLKRLAGAVHGRTTNGGLQVELAGSRWDGEGLDVETTNGGVRLTAPDNYSARLETGTVNGGVHVDFPIKVSGEVRHAISTTLGSGGALIRLKTTNGGVSIGRGTV